MKHEDLRQFTPTYPLHIQLLIGAREHVRNGWCQNHREMGDLVCPIQSVEKAAYGILQNRLAISAAIRSLNIAAGGDMIAFNDSPGRTKKEVLAVIGEAIASELIKWARGLNLAEADDVVAHGEQAFRPPAQTIAARLQSAPRP